MRIDVFAFSIGDGTQCDQSAAIFCTAQALHQIACAGATVHRVWIRAWRRRLAESLCDR